MPEGISSGASLFGHALGMDEHTSRMLKTKFPRVCVKITPDFKFPTSVLVDLTSRLDVVKATYKWKPVSCEKCCRFGHQTAKCSKSSLGAADNLSDTSTRQLVQRSKGYSKDANSHWQPRQGDPSIGTEEQNNPIAFTSTRPRASSIIFACAVEVGEVYHSEGQSKATGEANPVLQQGSTLRTNTETSNRYGVLNNLDYDDDVPTKNCDTEFYKDQLDTSSEMNTQSEACEGVETIAQSDNAQLEETIQSTFSVDLIPGKGGTSRAVTRTEDTDITEAYRLAKVQAKGDRQIQLVNGPTLRSSSKAQKKVQIQTKS